MFFLEITQYISDLTRDPFVAFQILVCRSTQDRYCSWSSINNFHLSIWFQWCHATIEKRFGRKNKKKDCFYEAKCSLRSARHCRYPARRQIWRVLVPENPLTNAWIFQQKMQEKRDNKAKNWPANCIHTFTDDTRHIRPKRVKIIIPHAMWPDQHYGAVFFLKNLCICFFLKM